MKLVPVAIMLFSVGLISSPSRREQRPESLVRLGNDRLGWGPVLLGMSTRQAEDALGGRLRLSRDDSETCPGMVASVVSRGARIVLTFASNDDRDALRLVNVFIPFSEPRDLAELVTELKRRVPQLRYRSTYGVAEVQNDKPLYEYPKDSWQTVLIGPTEGIWISRGCGD